MEDPTKPLDVPNFGIEWTKTCELGYQEEQRESSQHETVCFHCGAIHTKLLKCAKCKVAAYCQKDCQVASWKKGHKVSCRTYARLVHGEQLSQEDKPLVRNEIFGRVRFYACPFCILKTSIMGKGFLFIQSNCTLAQLSLGTPKDIYGKLIDNRGLLMYYLTMGEYDSEVCREDFELAEVRSDLQKLVNDYDEESQVVLFMRFRCGHVAVGIAPLVPDVAICRKLADDYYGETDPPALQLNLDDV